MSVPLQSKAYKEGYDAYRHSKLLHSTATPRKGLSLQEFMEWYEGFNDAIIDDMEDASSPADTGTEFPKLSS